METPEDQILREFYRLPRREHMPLLIAVMRQLGLTGFTRTSFLSRAGYAWMMFGVVALAAGMFLAAWFGRRPPGRLELTTDPCDAVVFFDDHTRVGERPRLVWGEPGPHTLSVGREGYELSQRTVWLTEGPQQLHVVLEPYHPTAAAR
jgi:hypothetical protein